VSFDFPANVERDIERYASSARITPAEAAVKLVRAGLEAQEATTNGLTEEEWEKLRAIPMIAFGESLSDEDIDRLEAYSRELRGSGPDPRE